MNKRKFNSDNTRLYFNGKEIIPPSPSVNFDTIVTYNEEEYKMKKTNTRRNYEAMS